MRNIVQVFGFGVWLQIIFCSYIKEPTLFSLPENGRSLCFDPKDIHVDQMIKQLLNSVIAKYRDLSLSSLCTEPPSQQEKSKKRRL